jgi:signal transduction histidine kinase
VFRDIRWRLVGWSMGVLALVLALAGAVVYVVLAQSLVSDIDRELATRGGLVAERLLERAEGQYQFRREGYIGGLFYLIVTPGGEILANPQHAGIDALPPTLFPHQGPSHATVTLDDEEPARLYLTALPPRQSGPVALAVGQSLAAEYDTLRRTLLGLLAAGVVGLLLSFAGAWFLAGRALVPIEDAFRRQQEFVADASHELRTPLTILRSAADLLNQHRAEPLEANGELLDDMREEIIRLERQAADLLTLARADLRELGLAMGEVDVGALANDFVRRSALLAQSYGVALTCQRPETPLVVEADPDRLQQVLLILLDNALKHTPAGGTVTIAARRDWAHAWLEVRDSGEGIAPADLERIFHRFYRAGRDRARDDSGAGLGLPIARALVEAHGGQLHLASTPGKGTTATIRLPLQSAAYTLAERLGRFAATTVRGAGHR